MPDFTLSELRDYLAVLDVLQRMGDRAEDAGFAPVFSLFPGQVPVVSLPDACLPLGVMGRFDPVQSVVPSRHDQSADDLLTIMRSDLKHPPVVASSSPATEPDGLPGSLAGQAADPSPGTSRFRKPFVRPDAWSAEDDATLIDGVAQDVLAGRRMFEGATRMAPILNRPVQGTIYRVKSKLRERIAARVAELVAQNAEAGGASPAPEQARDVAAVVSAAPARADEDAAERWTSGAAEQAGAVEQPPLIETEWGAAAPVAPADRDAAAQAGTLPAEQAGAGDVEPIAPAPADPVAQGVPLDALTEHLLHPVTRRNTALEWDVEMMRMIVTGLPAGTIADELGIAPWVVTARMDLLTGLNRETKARRFGRADVLARLEVLVAASARLAANPATAAA